MIKSFGCKETKKLFSCEFSRKLPQAIQKVALRKLEMIDYANDLIDLQIPPSNQLEGLQGDRLGQYSIRINQQYRVCFEWKDGHAYNVTIVDYH